MKICDEELCTGCMACYHVCPVRAISIVENEEGFSVPKIDDEKCCKCNKCINTCHINLNLEIKNKKKAYAAWSKNNHVRRNSSSGGAFSVFAKAILDEGGVVFAAGYDNDFVVRHKSVDNENLLSSVRGSKYVQSDLDDSFPRIKQYLSEGAKVLFVGTPCQCASLRSFLQEKTENLVICDLICHGVASPKIFKEYLEYMKKKYNSKIKNVYFRDKDKSWKCFNMRIDFTNGQSYKKNLFEDIYHVGFLKNIFLRQGCHHCKYATIERVSDITLSDFWGYFKTKPFDIDTDKGISLIMINTESGEKLFDKVKNEFCYMEKPFDGINKTQPCLNKPFSPSPNRGEFWENYHKFGFEYVADKYMSKSVPSSKYYSLLYKYRFPMGEIIYKTLSFPKNVRKKINVIIKK